MNRIANVVLFLLFFALTARGAYVLATSAAPEGNRQDAAQTTAYILLAVFAALTLVFGYTLMTARRSA